MPPIPPSGASGALEPLEEWLDVIFATSPIGMGIISALGGRYVRANQRLADLLGIAVADLLADDPYSIAQRITHPDDIVAEQRLFAELAVGARASYTIEKRIQRADGTMRWAEVTMGGIHGDPIDFAISARPLRYAMVQMIDVTERKALAETLARREEELRHAQKVDGIGRLAAGIAHDFNNLITVIMGNAEVLKSHAETGTPSARELDEGLDAILGACARAASLTAQVLAHGRRETVTLRTFSLSEAVGKSQRLLSRTIGSDVDVDHALAAEGSILADQNQVGQVVMNLILNARDAVSTGGRITLATRDLVIGPGAVSAVPGPGQWVVLSVSDDGHGMSPETRARIFEPFFTTRTNRPGTQGTGLGLSTVLRIVSEVGGFVDVESAPGRGTTVTVYFPLAASAPPKLAGPEEPRRAGPPPNSRRVLVIEDDAPVRSLVANVLLGAHYRVVVARDGEEGLRLLETEREPFHLIVSDLVMPHVGGVALAERLRERADRPPLLFISGYSTHTPAELEVFGRLLPKPFAPAQLLEAVRETMDETMDGGK